MIKERIFEIYKITNIINNKVYVGITNQGYKTRWYKHCSDAIRDCGFPLHLAMQKHGIANFKIEVIDIANTIQELKDKEKYWISHYNSNNREIGYNLTEGGDGTFGRKHSEETKEKIRQKVYSRVKNGTFLRVENNPHLEKEIECFKTDGSFLRKYESATKAAIELSINKHCVARCARGVLNTYKGYIFKYTNIDRPIVPKIPKSIIPKVNKPRIISEEVKHRISETNKLRWTPERKVKYQLHNNKNRSILQYTLNGEFIKEYISVAHAVRELNLKDHHGIALCARGGRKKSAGFIWRYKA
jgi:group I intron endonuclease